MKQTTSIESYNTLKETGGLQKKQREVLRLLVLAGKSIPARDLPAGSWKRLSELRQAGVVGVSGSIVDQVTKRRVLLWTATGQEPMLRPITLKRKTRAQLEYRIKELEAVVDRYPTIVANLYDAAYLHGRTDYKEGRQFSGDNI